jgi:hypothetical protein
MGKIKAWKPPHKRSNLSGIHFFVSGFVISPKGISPKFA